ncbi:MAG TPA: ABC transporter permease [Puia sp.]|nr:ABC transporter permease [Puia sp.]
MLRNYFKIAFRKLTRNKVYTFINILGLAIGVSACLIIYLITNFELSYDTFHPDKERIYRLVAEMKRNKDDEGRKFGFLITPLPMALRNEVAGFESVSAFFNYYPKVTVQNGNSIKKFDAAKFGEGVSDVIVAEPQYFEIFKYQWLAGNPAVALNEPFKVVLSEKEVQKYFGPISPEEAMGRQVIYNDSLNLTVSGVVKDWTGNTDFGFKDFISFNTVQHSFLKDDIDMNAWGMWNYFSQGIVKLPKGTDPKQIEKKFASVVKKHVFTGKEEGAAAKVSLQPLSDIHFNSDYEDAYTRKAHLPTLYGLMGIAAFILIIAAINFVNLSAAQSIQRAKEIGIRKVMGSNRRNIIIQFLSETFILTLLAVILSVIITNPVISLLYKFIPAGVKLSLLDPSTILFLSLITIITSLLAGFYPAKVLSSLVPALSLKGQATKKPNQKSYLHKGLIVFQFTISLVFIIGTIIVSRQIHFIVNKDLGFTKDAIITIRTGYNYPSNKRMALAEDIKGISGVQIVSSHMETPTAKGHPGTFILYRGKSEMKTDASFDMCDMNYIPLFDLKIIAGRNLFPSDTIREFLINETCAKQLGFAKPEDAIGKPVEIGMNGGKGPVVGVIKDFNSKSLHEPIIPFFMSSFKRAERAISIKLATEGKGISHFQSILSQIQKLWKAEYPNEKFEYSFFDQTIARLYEKEQKTSALMNLAMIIAIFISCMGLLGLATYAAEQRTKEIGIRKVLGASVTNIVSMLTKDFVWLVAIAILVASPIAYYFMYKWLEDFAYKIQISWWIFVMAGAIAVVIALITVSFQAIKAAIANPVKSLRTE